MKILIRITIPFLLVILSGCAHHGHGRHYSAHSGRIGYGVGVSSQVYFPAYPAYYNRHVYIEQPVVVHEYHPNHSDYSYHQHKQNKHQKPQVNHYFPPNKHSNNSERFTSRKHSTNQQLPPPSGKHFKSYSSPTATRPDRRVKSYSSKSPNLNRRYKSNRK